jgi:tungstate transport system ATP-binding protein
MIRIKFSKIEKSFARRKILDGVDIELVSGECLLLCGKNGSGKSTLLKILAGMERPEHAEIELGCKRYSWRQAKKILLHKSIYLHQSPYLFEGSVRRNLDYPLRGARAARRNEIEYALEWAELEALADENVAHLSGGERQRVALARALLRKPQVMLLDEPTANMDAGSRQRTLNLLEQLKHEGIALVVVTHDPVHFIGKGEQRLMLQSGKLIKPEKPLVAGNISELKPVSKVGS